MRSLSRHHKATDFEVVVVDSGSFDGCAEMLAAEFPSAIFLQSEENLGFARANNLGASRACGQSVLFLNPDTEFIEDTIQVLAAQLETLPGAGAVGCRLLNRDRSLQTSCVQPFPTVLNRVIDSEFLRRRFPRWKIWGMRPLFAGRAVPVDAVSGACILMERQFFLSIGGFAEVYFMYGEDVDLCYKIKQAGLRVYYIPETSLLHFGGGSSQQSASNFSNVMLRESTYRFMQRHRGTVTAILFRSATTVVSMARMILVALLLPFPGRSVVQHGAGSLQKWLAILRWGLGLECWVRRYPKSQDLSAAR